MKRARLGKLSLGAVLGGLSGCATVKTVLWVPVAIVLVPVLIITISISVSTMIFMEQTYQQNFNGIGGVYPIPESSDYLVSYRLGKDQFLLRVNRDSDEAEVLSEEGEFSCFPSLHPDGRYLVYVEVRRPKGKTTSIKEVDLQTGKERTLVVDGRLLASPVYVNGSSVAYLGAEGKHSRAYVWDRESETSKVLSEGDEESDFKLFPYQDGEHILIMRTEEAVMEVEEVYADWYSRKTICFQKIHVRSGRVESVSEKWKGDIRLRAVPGSDALMVNGEGLASMDKPEESSELSWRIWAHLKESIDGDSLTVLPTADLQTVYFVVRRGYSDGAWPWEVYQWTRDDDRVDLVGEYKADSVAPKLNESGGELFFRSLYREEFYIWDLEEKVMDTLTLKLPPE